MKRFLFTLVVFVLSANVYAQYKVGDFYNVDGIKGVVFKVDDTGEHGLIVSLNIFNGKWTNDKKAKFSTNAFYEDDGEKNMKSVESYLKETGQSWSAFPFYEWCRNLGEGWYAPAMNEMKELITAINGSLGSYSSSNYYKFESILTEHGGDKLHGKCNDGKGHQTPYTMYTSTEAEGGKIYLFGCFATSPFADPKILIGPAKKTISINMGSRAIHKF